MAIHDVGLEEVARIIKDAIQDGLAGTGTNAIDFTDTTLQTPITATIQNVTISRSENIITVRYVMPPAIGNGNTYYEWGTRLSGDVLLNRSLTTGTAKTSDLQITRILTIRIGRT